MEAENMPLGSPMGKLLWGPFLYCRWPTRQLPVEFRKPRLSGVETLLLSGSADFSTPPEFATKELLPYLKNGRQIVLSEYGHVNDMWYINIENTRLILTSFYRTGVPNASMISYMPMDFGVRWGFPMIAKLALGVVAFLVLALVALVAWLTKRHRRSNRRRRQTRTRHPIGVFLRVFTTSLIEVILLEITVVPHRLKREVTCEKGGQSGRSSDT
jgi:hypothetical protein